MDPGVVSTPEHAHSILANAYGFYSVPHEFHVREVYGTLKDGQVYEPRTLQMLQSMALDGDIVSGGAFVGDFLPALSRSVRPGALVHSFDPNPVAYKSALHTIALNGLKNVCLSNVAVGRDRCRVSLQIAKAQGETLAGSARVLKQAQEGLSIDVACVPLDQLVPADRKVSVLHLDVEGFEIPALLGAKGLIRRWRPLLVLEAPKPRTQRVYMQFIRTRFPELGYRAAGSFERNMFVLADSR